MCVCVCVCSVVTDSLHATPWTAVRQAPLSMGFPEEEYWSGLPFPSPGDFPNPGIEPLSAVSSALAGRFFTTGATWFLCLPFEIRFFKKNYFYLFGCIGS